MKPSQEKKWYRQGGARKKNYFLIQISGYAMAALIAVHIVPEVQNPLMF
jgi:hypothetical protein